LYNSLGLAFAAQGDLTAAITAYRKSSDLWSSKERKFPLRNWADAQTALDPKADVVPLLQQALDADRGDALTFNALGAELAKQHKLGPAMEQYEAASKLWAASPNRKYAFRNWSGALFEQGDTEQALAKAKEALAADGGDPETYNLIGYLLSTRLEFDKAIEQYRIALDLYDNSVVLRDENPDGHALACCNLGDVLQRLERFDEAAKHLRKATEIKPNDSDIRFRYGNLLSTTGCSREAIEQYGRAVDLDGGNLYARNNKANELFRLGRYEAGWLAWEEARTAYQEAMTAAAARDRAERTRTDAERAGYCGYMLTDVFADFPAADQAFEFALEIADDYPLALCGRAMLYRRWVDSEAVTMETRLRAGKLMRDACNAVQPVPDTRDPRHYANLIMLATLAVANREFSAALKHLSSAERAAGDLSLRRAEIAVLHGVICLGNEDYEAAIRYFRQALFIKGDDIDVQTRLGQALLGAKRHDDARRAFARVLEVAPGHIDCLVGQAVARIELGDAGHPEHYERAEQSLNAALLNGRDRQSGSLKLRKVRTAAILYLRGYARVKRWETGAGQARFGLLQDALNDFRQCLDLNPGHDLAAAAIEKIGDRGLRHIDDVLANRIGPLLLFGAGLVVFVLAVGLGLARGKSTDPGYLAMTFGGLAIAMAGLSLPSLLKLKVAGIELQKAAPERSASAAAIGLGQFSMGDALNLPTPNSFPADSSGPPPSQPKDSSHRTEKASAA
jgi:tetratricopeptide (TPR) repeat protein